MRVLFGGNTGAGVLLTSSSNTFTNVVDGLDLTVSSLSDEPVTVTRHGRRVGVFIPTRGDRAEAIAAYQAATEKLPALMAEQGIDEDEVIAEFDTARKARRKAQRATTAAS